MDAARKDAQETYFEPTRNGISDDINVLLGGAYEQIAILTRLAFAKLMAKQGRQVPLILDDALVIRMTNAF